MPTEPRQIQVTGSAVRKLLSQVQYSGQLFTAGNAIAFPDARLDVEIDRVTTRLNDPKKGGGRRHLLCLFIGEQRGVGRAGAPG